MEIIVVQTPDEVAQLAAHAVARVVRDAGPRAVLGVATGSSPLALYSYLADMVEHNYVDFSEASAFALDEYVGLAVGHPESYAEVIRRTVTEPLRFDPERVHVPNGAACDIAAAAREYDAAIKAAGGVDVQILGLGANGHIGFNEPTSSLSSRTRIKTLTPKTRADNARFFDSAEHVPTHCLTQGLGTIMEAREIVLVAQGSSKAEAIAAVVEGPLTAMVPGSVLQLHEHATIIVDAEAAAELRLTDYYRHTWEHKPAWQKFEV